MVKFKKYTAYEQYASLRSTYENSFGHLMPNGFSWLCDLQPSPISQLYQIKIVYTDGYPPSIYIVSPKPLKLAKNAERLPHTYDTKKQQLCLYRPQFNEWNRSMLISQTIVHWALSWLYFYEEWVSTGIWKGGGHGNWDIIPRQEDRDKEL